MYTPVLVIESVANHIACRLTSTETPGFAIVGFRHAVGISPKQGMVNF